MFHNWELEYAITATDPSQKSCALFSNNYCGLCLQCMDINTLRPRPNGRHFADDIFKCIFLNENVWIPIEISLKFVPKGPINNIPALVQIMAWRRLGDKPLSEPMMVSLITHICVTRPQWVKQWSHWNYTLFWPQSELSKLCTAGIQSLVIIESYDDPEPIFVPLHLRLCFYDLSLLDHHVAWQTHFCNFVND